MDISVLTTSGSWDITILSRVVRLYITVATLNGIIVNRIIWLMGKIEPDLPVPNYSFIPNSFTYCNHLFNVISLGLAQSDHNKRSILYTVS